MFVMSIRVVAAEDSYLIREGLRLLLTTQEDFDLVASVATLPDLLAAVDKHSPDVVVTDVRMPPGDQDEGIQAAEATGALVFHAGTALRGGRVTTNGGRILDVTGLGETIAAARAAAYAAADLISFPGARRRDDIALAAAEGR